MIASKSLSGRVPQCTAMLFLAGLVVEIALAPYEVAAAGLDVQSSLSATASSVWRTDQNNELDEGAGAEGVLTFRPQTSLIFDGKQFDINADLGVQHTIFTDNGSSRTTPEVSINALKNFFGAAYVLSGLIGASSQIENANSRIDNIIVDSGKTPITYNLQIQQNAQRRLGSNAIVRAQHTSANSQSTLDNYIGSNTHTLQIESEALLNRTGMIGGVIGGYQLTDFENDIQGYNGMVSSELQIPLTAAISMTVLAGYEWLSFEQGEEELAGEMLYLGFSWEPTARLSAELGYGERLFGVSPLAVISYTGRRSGLSLSWARSLQSNRLSDLTDEIDAATIDVEEAGDEELLNFDGLDSSSIFLNQQRNINEIVALELFFDARRTNYTALFALVETEQINVSDVKSVSNIASLRAARTYGQSLDMGLEAEFSSVVDEDDNESTRSKIGINLEWRF